MCYLEDILTKNIKRAKTVKGIKFTDILKSGNIGAADRGKVNDVLEILKSANNSIKYNFADKTKKQTRKK